MTVALALGHTRPSSPLRRGILANNVVPQVGKGSSVSKVCALVGAGDFNANQFLVIQEAGAFDYVIAVDGGYESLQDAGVKPDMVLGDFDSLGYVPKGIRTSRFSEHKDKSDMELAFERAKSQRYDTVYAFGALGGRLDHTLANIQVGARFSELGLSVFMVGDQSVLVYVTGPDAFEAEAREEGTVSVFALSDVCEGVFERGMEWDLDDVELTNRTSEGLSNELKGEPVMIGVEKGTIVIFFPI